MLKKSITYEDFNGDEQTEDYYFNLTKAELVEVELGVKGGSLTELLKIVIATTDGAQIIEAFKRIISMSYGRRSPDGTRFLKTKDIFEEFSSTGAYHVLFMELATDADKASAFINGIMPGGNVQQALAEANSNKSDSDIARERSQANLAGFKKKADHEGSDIQDVPTPAEPAQHAIFEDQRSVTSDPPEELRSVTKAPKEDLSKLTKAQLMARLNGQS